MKHFWTYAGESGTTLTHFMQIITLLPVSKFYENLHA